MAQWQNEIYQNYISGKMSEQGRSNYEADVIAGIIQAPEGSVGPWAQTAQSYIDTGMQQAQQPTEIPAEVKPAHKQEITPYQVPDDVWKRFSSGQMSDEGMKNLIGDMRDGIITAPETEDVSIFGELKDVVTGEKRRVAETEKLESWMKMPDIWQLDTGSFLTHLGALAASPDELATTVKKNKPDVGVAQDSKGNYVFTSAINGKQYAVKPGFRPSDMHRALTMGIVYALGSKGKTPLRRIGGTGVTQAGVEASQELSGGRFDALEVPIAMAFEGGGGLVGKGLAALKGYAKSAPPAVRKALKAAGVDLGEDVATTAEKAVRTAEEAGVTPLTSDVFEPKTWSEKSRQIATERIPVIGTGQKRVQQQADRVEAVRTVLRDYGADETARASDDVMEDLLKKRGADIKKYTGLKKEVIERLSKGADEASEAFDPKNLVHRRTEGSLSDRAMVTQFAEGNKSESYGQHAWVLKSKLPKAADDKKLIKFTEDFYGVGKEEAKELVDPEKIVSSAGAWDDEDFIQALYEKYEPVGYMTNDGAVVIDRDAVKLKYIDTATPTNTVPINKTTAAIDAEITRLKGLDNKDVEPLIDALENSRTSFTDKSLDVIEDNRKLLGETLDDAGFEKVKSQAGKVKKKLYDAVREDMGDFIKKTGEPRDFNKWSVANKRLSGMMEDLDMTGLKSIIKQGRQTPEDVKKLLFSKKPSQIKYIYKSLTPEGKKNARVAIWQQALEKAGGIDDLSTAKFQSELKRLENSTGVFFKGEDKKVLDGLVKTLKITKRAEQAGVAPPTGVQNYQLILASLLGGGTVAGGIGVPIAAGTLAAAARAYESKPVRNILIKIAKGKGKEQVLIKQLANVLKTKRQFTKKSVSPAEQRRAIELLNQDS
jgi:hypothetical protein